MKVFLTALVACAALSCVKAHAEDVSGDSEIRCFKNFDAKIKSLENYTVTYVEPHATKSSAVTRKKNKNDEFKVKLIASRPRG